MWADAALPIVGEQPTPRNGASLGWWTANRRAVAIIGALAAVLLVGLIVALTADSSHSSFN